MGRQVPCDGTFESYDYTHFKNIKSKSRRPRGSALERFEYFSTKMGKRSIAPPHAEKSKGQNFYMVAPIMTEKVKTVIAAIFDTLFSISWSPLPSVPNKTACSSITC